MSEILTHPYIMIPLFGIAVFAFCYVNIDRLIAFLHERSLGNREEVMKLMDMMFVETDKQRVTMMMIVLSAGLGFLVFLASWPNLIFGFFLGCVVTILGWSAPKVVMKALWEKRCDRFVNQMVDALTIMANGIKAGLSVTQGIERVTNIMNGPVSQEFGLVLNKVRLGMSLEEALNELGDRIQRADVQMFVTAINILKETGGNLGETFTTIVVTIRERQKIEKKIQALTAQGTMQGIIISFMPFVLLGVFLVMDPNYVKPLFDTPLGWFMLFIMLALEVIGGVMMKKIVTIKV